MCHISKPGITRAAEIQEHIRCVSTLQSQFHCTPHASFSTAPLPVREDSLQLLDGRIERTIHDDHSSRWSLHVTSALQMISPCSPVLQLLGHIRHLDALGTRDMALTGRPGRLCLAPQHTDNTPSF